MIAKIIQILVELLTQKIPAPVVPTVPTNTDKLLEEALAVSGLDPTPKDEINDEVACSEVMSTLIKKVYDDFPILPSTRDLDLKLYQDKRFERVLLPEKGCIVLSPRTATTFGHVGIFVTKDKIMSNDSRTGKFIQNYTWTSWIKEFKTKRGLSIYLYRVV